MDVRRGRGRLTLAPGARHAVATGFAIAIPQGYEIQVRPRSGLALKHGISVPQHARHDRQRLSRRGEGDPANLGAEPFEIVRGERIAQLVPAPVTQARCEEVEELDETARGAGGFGSTGR